MGAITPIASGLSSIAGTFGTINTIVNTVQTLSGAARSSEDIALRQLQERQNLALSQQAADNALAKDRLAAESAASASDRKRALKRAVAKQRANFGGQGISTNSGSAQAILLGLFDESEAELAERQQLDSLKTAALDQDYAQSQSLNVLQRTQLQQRQQLSSSISGFGDLF